MLSLEALEDRQLLSISAPSLPLGDSHTAMDPAAVVAPASAVDAVPTMNLTADPQAVGATISSVRDGLWSDAGTWSVGRVPASIDDVTINNNVTIDHAQARQVDIRSGTTTLAGDLQAYGSVIVRSRLVGTQGGIFFHVADDRLFTGNTQAGPDATMPDFHPEDVGLWALRGGTIDLQGAAVTSWLNAVASGPSQDLGNGVSQQNSFRAGSATLQAAPVGWQPGDTLLLVNEHGQSTLADLVSVNGTSLQYHEQKATPTAPDLVGHSLVTVGSSTVVTSKIANLTRRIQIVGADVHTGDTNHRAHTAILDGATANLANVEFRDLGPRGKLGRYPVYFDRGGAITSKLTGSSLWQDVTDPGNRFVALRDVQGVTVSNNVAFRGRGDGFVMEDSRTFGNTLLNNLSVAVTGDEELPNANSNVTALTHHYWLRTGNTISGNVAAGGNAVGMIVLASTNTSTAVVNDLQVLNTGLFGFWTGTPNVTFNNPVAVYNARAGFASEPAWDVDSHGTTLNNPLLLFNGTSDSSYGSQIYLNDSDVINVNGGVLAGTKAVHTHYHSAFVISNTKINVDTLLTPTYWEQMGVFDHATIRAELLFERAYPSPRYTSPGIVRFTAVNAQVGDEPAELETADYIGDTFQNYPTIPGFAIPNAIELDQPAPASGFIRVTMLSDADRWMSNISNWTVTPVGQTPLKTSFIYHRQTAWTQLAGLGGYPDGFPPGEYAVSLYTENGTLLKKGFAVVRPGQVSDIIDALPTTSASVVGRQLFYNGSKYDGNNAAITTADDNAIAPGKVAYQPGTGQATSASLSNYSRGINGIAIDLAGPGSHASIQASDFIFKTGNNNGPGGWQTAPAPTAISVRLGAGVSGSDRVEIVWGANAVKNAWLEVQVRATANTGLTSSDVYFWGNVIGDANLNFSSTPTDAIQIANNQTATGVAALSNPRDIDRDGTVAPTDAILAINNQRSIVRLNVTGGPFSPVAESMPTAIPASSSVDEGEVASALASTTASGATLPAPTTPLPAWLSDRLSKLKESSGPAAAYFQQLAERDTPAAQRALLKAGQLEASFNLDDALLESLTADLKWK